MGGTAFGPRSGVAGRVAIWQAQGLAKLQFFI